MSCPACTTRLLRIFVHDTATTTLLLTSNVYRSSRNIPHLPPYTRRIPISSASSLLSIAHINRYSTAATTANSSSSTSTSSTPPSESAPTITREYHQTQLWTQRHNGGDGGGGNRKYAYSQRRLSDDDYMPFITDLPPPPLPPLGGDRGGRSMMRRMFPGIPGVPGAVHEIVKEDGLEEGEEGGMWGIRKGLEAERGWEMEREKEGEKVVQSVAVVRGGGRIRPGMANRERFLKEVKKVEENFSEVEMEVDVSAEPVENKVEVKEMGYEKAMELEEEEKDIVIQAVSELTAKMAEERITVTENAQIEAGVDASRSKVEGRRARKDRRIQQKMERLLALQALPTEHQSEEIKGELKQLKQKLSKLLGLPVKKEDQMKSSINTTTAKQINMDKAQAASIDGNNAIPAEIEEHVKNQVFNAMKELAVDPDISPPLNLPIRGNLPTTVPSTASGASEQIEAVSPNITPSNGLKADKSTLDSDRPMYKNSWVLPISKPQQPRKPRPSSSEASAIKSLERTLLGPKPTPESILRNPHLHPEWLVQKSALKKKLGDKSWKSHTKISPGTVELIKAISAEAPNVLKASEIAQKFKISPESARRILHSKWTPRTPEEKEKRARKWVERGEKIRLAMVERGEIWTKERRKANWEANERRRKTREYMVKFGIKKGRGQDDDSGSSVDRSFGRINWEGKFI